MKGFLFLWTTMMLTISKWRSSAGRMMRDTSGNFAMMTAVALPAALVGVGVAIDLSNMLSSRSQLQNAADSASLAAASTMANKGMSEADAILLVDSFIKGQMANDARSQGSTYSAPTNKTTITETTGADGAKSYRVNVASQQSVALSAFMSLVNRKTMTVSVKSEGFSSQEMKSNPISMYLVLDQSGSMSYDTSTVDPTNPTKSVSYDCSYYSGGTYIQKTCYSQATNYIVKKDALKTAVANLMAQLDTADPNKKYVRTGVATFATNMNKSTSLEWGTATVKTVASGLWASGNTNPVAAMTQAVTALTAASEDQVHKDKNGGVPTKFIIYMTDGDNSSTSYDTATKQQCDKARTAGIQVFTIGFMVNTTRATTLLSSCATTSADYMSADNVADLNNNFKSIGQKATAAITRLTN